MLRWRLPADACGTVAACSGHAGRRWHERGRHDSVGLVALAEQPARPLRARAMTHRISPNPFSRHLCRCLTPKPTQMSRPWRHSLWLNASAWAIPVGELTPSVSRLQERDSRARRAFRCDALNGEHRDAGGESAGPLRMWTSKHTVMSFDCRVRTHGSYGAVEISHAGRDGTLFHPFTPRLRRCHEGHQGTRRNPRA